jgi:hypothetical protein
MTRTIAFLIGWAALASGDISGVHQLDVIVSDDDNLARDLSDCLGSF